VAPFLYLAEIFKLHTMALLSEIIYNIKNLRDGGTESDDSKLTRAQLEFIVNHFRAEIAGQRTNQNKALDGFYQELENVKLKSTKDFRPTNKDVIILKSIDQIPSPIVGHDNGYVLQTVGLRDEFLGFQPSSVHTFNIDLENQYVQSIYFVVDNYVYIATKSYNPIREVFIRGVFENPRQVIYSQTGGENLLLGYDWEYPYPTGLLSQLNSLTINNEYRWMNMFPADVTNNNRDDKQ
jgi:hypothetical protein